MNWEQKYDALASMIEGYRHERNEALERLRLLEAEVERVNAREDATRRELAETRIDMRDAQRERDEARAERDLARERFENAVQSATRYAVERDEARAEVERLRNAVHSRACRNQSAYNLECVCGADEHQRDLRKLAFRRGAEAMREACAQWVDHWVSGHVADKLRGMPIPEEP